MVGWNALGLLPGRDRALSTAKVPRQQRAAWAADLDAASRDGWMEVQARFGLTDVTLLSVIRILKVNDKYPPGHSLRDPTAYPAQVGRAFAILAGSGAGTPHDFGTLTKDLEMKLVSGARFPDEPPGERHLHLSPELSENTVVLAIIDLLRRRQHDPGVRDVLAALQQGHG